MTHQEKTNIKPNKDNVNLYKEILLMKGQDSFTGILIQAAKTGHTQRIKELINAGVRPTNTWAIRFAEHYKYFDIVKILKESQKKLI